MNDSQQIGEIFRIGLSIGPEPDPAIWEQIQKRMKIRDFWRSSKWIWAGTAVLGIATIAWIIGKQSAETTAVTETVSIQQTIPQPAEEQTIVLQAMNTSSKEGKNTENAYSHQTDETVFVVPNDGKSPLSETVESEAPVVTTNPFPEEKTVPQNVMEPQAKVPETKAVPAISQQQPSTETKLAETALEETADSLHIIFPSAFTPNGDGLNDTYRPDIDGETIQYLLRIYNPTRQLVFQTTHPEEAWDGTFRGNAQPHGVYLYQLLCTDKKGNKYSRQGSFLILRH